MPFTPFAAGQIWTATICNLLASGWISIDGAGVFTYASTDGHTFVINTPADLTGLISPGARFRCTNQGSVQDFVVTVITTTTMTLYGGQNYSLTATTISSVSFSTFKAPNGFPLSPTLWTEKYTSTTANEQTNPVSGTWYNFGDELVVPIGDWWLDWEAGLRAEAAVGTGDEALSCAATLSTANSSESDPEFSAELGSEGSAAVSAGFSILGGLKRGPKSVLLAAKTTYYLNAASFAGTPSYVELGRIHAGQITIRAVCAYL